MGDESSGEFLNATESEITSINKSIVPAAEHPRVHTDVGYETAVQIENSARSTGIRKVLEDLRGEIKPGGKSSRKGLENTATTGKSPEQATNPETRKSVEPKLLLSVPNVVMDQINQQGRAIAEKIFKSNPGLTESEKQRIISEKQQEVFKAYFLAHKGEARLYKQGSDQKWYPTDKFEKSQIKSAGWKIIRGMNLFVQKFGGLESRMLKSMGGPFDRLGKVVQHMSEAAKIRAERAKSNADNYRTGQTTTSEKG